MLRKVKNLMFHRGRTSDPAAAERALARAKAKQHLRNVRTRQHVHGAGLHFGGDGGF